MIIRIKTSFYKVFFLEDQNATPLWIPKQYTSFSLFEIIVTQWITGL